MRRNDYVNSDNYGELKEYPCITPCYDGKIRYEKTKNKCDRCDGDGRIKYWQDTGSIIPGFRTKTWYESCIKCLGTGKEILLYFKCYDCNGGTNTYRVRKRGLFGWREVKETRKCSKCNGVGFTEPSSYDLSRE
jgi:DnaJ-class molecular chaperone